MSENTKNNEYSFDNYQSYRLRQIKNKYGILQKDLSSDEISRLVNFEINENLRVIKNCTVFFTILTAISIVVSFFTIVLPNIR